VKACLKSSKKSQSSIPSPFLSSNRM